MAINLILGHTLKDVKNAVIGEIKPYVQDFLCKNIIVVPDRYSLVVEKSVFDVLKISSTFNIQVMGINSLARKLIEDAHLGCVFVDAEQSDFVLYRAIQNTKDNFICLSKTMTTGLVEKIKNSLALLRSSDITSQNLDIDQVDDERLKDKLHDIKLVMEEYEKLLDFRLDATTLLRTFSTLINSTKMYQDVNFYFCGFDSFTAQGYTIVEKICKVAKNVTIGLITPTKFKNKTIYDNEMLNNFVSYFDKEKIEYTQKYISPKFDGDQKQIFENVFGYNIQNSNIKSTVISLPKMRDEIENVAMQIAYLTKNDGLKFQDIAVASSQNYFSLIENIFSKYGISFYIDDSQSISRTPLYSFLSCIFNAITMGLEKENVVDLIENYFFDIDKQKKYETINYIREKNIQYKKISKIYDVDEKIKYIFEKISKINVLDTFSYYIDFVNDIYEYFDIKNNLEKISQIFNKDGDLSLEKIYVQIFDKIDDLNKKIVEILGNQKIKVKDFADFYLNALNNLTINKIPLGVDCTFVGDICKSFFEPKKYLFVIGANSAMPTRIKDESLILDQDIDTLSSKITISPTVKIINKRNKFRLFDNILSGENLIITYPLFDDAGRKNVRASFVDDFLKLGATQKTQEDYKIEDDISSIKLHTPNTVVARQFIDNTKVGAKIKNALVHLNEDVEYTLNLPNIPDASSLIKSEKIKITQLENYFVCPFKHFVSYGLRLVENLDGKMRQNDFGNFLHDFCNYFVKRMGASLGKIDGDTLEKQIDEVFEKLVNSDKYFLLRDDENDMVLEILKREVHRFGNFLNYEQQVSDFKIYKTEFKFDSDLKVKIDDKDYSIVGIVDRVDKYDNFYTVIDYKTGSQAKGNAQISNLYYGTKIQVYVYLKALTEKFNGKAFGAFYLPISNAFSDDSVDDYKLNGYFWDNVNLCEHLDNTLSENYQSRIFEASFSTSKENLKKGLKVLSSRKKVSEDNLQAMLLYSVEIVKQGLKEILNGNITPSPTEKACEFCAYKYICGHDENIYRKQNAKISSSTFKEVKYEWTRKNKRARRCNEFIQSKSCCFGFGRKWKDKCDD